MRTGHNSAQICIGTFFSPEDVSDFIDADVKTRRLHLLDHVRFGSYTRLGSFKSVQSVIYLQLLLGLYANGYFSAQLPQPN